MARRIVSHSIGMIVVKKLDSGLYGILSFDYTLNQPGRTPWKTVRVPLETGELGESISDTITRGLTEEVVDEAGLKSFTVGAYKGENRPAFFILGRDDKSESVDGLHLKAFFLVDFEGGLRNKVYAEDGPRGKEVHGLPQFREIGKLVTEMDTVGTIRAHKDAVIAATDSICCGDKEAAYNYGSIVGRHSEQAVSASDTQLMQEYVERHMKSGG